MTLDASANLTETVDLLAQENQSADYTDYHDYSSDSSAFSVAPMESLDGGTMLMSSTPEAPASAAEIFDYDYLGNRYHETSKNGTVYEYSHNPVNQYAKRHYSIMGYGFDNNYSYDDNGNLYMDSDGNTYIYDYRNRLIQAG